jgi:peptidoglycan/LPS O-acetylase OafA/YrhL
VSLALILPWLSEIKNRLIQRVSQIIAKYSYGIYLSHIAVMAFAFGLLLPLAPRLANYQ